MYVLDQRVGRDDAAMRTGRLPDCSVVADAEQNSPLIRTFDEAANRLDQRVLGQ
jgi:hypothetical protein